MWARARIGRRALLAQNPETENGYGTLACTEKAPHRNHEEGSNHPRSQPLPETWMSGLDDELPLSAITIPGTHDSAAFTSSWPFVTTQNMNITQQLDAGIRYFDLRCGLHENIVEMVHGLAFLGLSLEEVLQSMYDWLATHPSEGLVLQIKQDRHDSKSTVDFAHAIASIIRHRSSRWRTANTTPTVGELRGRIQLFRRFEGPSLYSYGIDVSQWEDNPRNPFTIYTSHCTRLTIQDHYSWSDPKGLPGLVAEKGGDVAGLLNRAAHDMDPHHWYINFTSAYEISFLYQVSPREIALGGYWGFQWEAGINVRLRNFLSQKSRHRKRYGIVVMDFPESGTDDLVLQVINTNFGRHVGLFWDAVCFWLPMIVVLVMASAFILLLLP